VNARFWFFAVVGLLILSASEVTRHREDERTIRVAVPQMASDRDVRIVTNAALDEIRGRYDGIRHEYQVDHRHHAVIYHEGQRLFDPAFRAHVEARIREIGFDGRFTRVAANPQPVLRNKKGEEFNNWPDRVTAVISVPGMKDNTDANRIVSAISLARGGDDPQHVRLDRENRTFTISFNGLLTAPRNIQHAIACSGFAANEVPARLGEGDAIAYGWTPVAADGV